MIFEPPVEKMTKKVGNVYLLSNLMAKRAKEIYQNPPECVIDGSKKELELAAEEIMSEKTKVEFI